MGIMRPRVDLWFVIRIWLLLISIKNSQCENAEPRALDLSVPWRPIPYHVPQQQLISVASFDTTSKDELVHIAQHNAHILKHFNQPVTQYHNQNNFQHQQQQQQQQMQHQPYKIPPMPFGGHTPGPKYMTTPLLLSNVSPAVQPSARHAKPFVKADQVTTLSIVHSSTPKSVTQISHLVPAGMKAAKFNAQFREPVLSAPPVTHPKSTLKPHSVMNNLPPHMGISYRQKQPVAAHSNRLEHFVTPNHLYGTFIQFGQASNPLQTAKTKFISQLASHPSFDAQLKGLLHAGVGSGYQQTLAHIKHLQKMNYLQQQNKLQSYYNQIPADVDVPKKIVSSAEKDNVKIPQVQQQQHQNKYSFSLKTQHPTPPSASAGQSSHMFKEKPHKPQFHYESQQIHGTPLHSFKEHHGGDSFGFTSYQNHQQLPIDHKPHEIVKFKDVKQHNVFNEIHDEYSKNLVPPPPSTQQAFLPTVINPPETSKNPIEILNKYNINPHSPLQDANRFSYDPFVKPSSFSHPSSSTSSTTSTSTTTTSTTTQPPSTTTPRYPYYSHSFNFGNDHTNYNNAVLDIPASNDWIGRDKFITTAKPNIFKQLFRPTESEYKQHKLMHPGYTGLPPNKRPPSTTPVATADSSSTEEPLITHSFFTIEDALTDRNKYKYTTEAEENRLDEPEIVTIGPYVDSQELITTAVYPMFRTKGKRRRPRPHYTTELANDSDSTENPIERPIRTRFRYRPRPTTEAESEIRTTLAPPTTTGFILEDTSLRKLRKKIPTNFNRNRFVANEPDLEQSNTDQQEGPTQVPPTTTTTTAPAPIDTFINPTPNDNIQSFNGGNGLRSRYRPAVGDRYNVIEQKPVRTKIPLPENSEESFKSAEIIRENESSRFNLKLPNYKPGLRLPTSGFVSSTTTTTTASITSDEITAENNNRNRSEPHRPRFSIKEYRNKMNRTAPSTTSTTTSTTTSSTSEVEVTTQSATKVRLPTRNRLLANSRLNKTNAEPNDVLVISTSTTELPPSATNETTVTRTSFRPSFTRNYNSRFTVKKATTDAPQQQPSSSNPSRGVNRGRIRLQDTTTQSTPNRTVVPSTLHTSTLASRRPPKISLRQRIQNRKKDPENTPKDSDQEGTSLNEPKPIDDMVSLGTIDTASPSSPTPPPSTASSTTTEGYRRHETSIMKISPKDSSQLGSFGDGDWDLNSASSDYSKRVVELTLSASKDKGFKSINKGLLSRRVPGYFTLATEDPILPIEAFFPQVKKVSA
ncbi:mucin-2-like isoform X2 [Toxorhynchites rutilus septentrionalis]|uniref:mucin-2-like isoform X2 n=1 Tax=Toxorhynchites rutilus septentrionalis TaxID=329112 RepID=UPI00247A49F9|nr:mucin-2-like isoform X2 [Toxorhynchites rutilus septentrionalis]